MFFFYKKPRSIHNAIFLACSLISSSVLAVEQTSTVLGTRAMGMGGAFVAVAADSSAIWYNPAGLGTAQDTAEVIIEVGDVVLENANYDDVGNELTPSYTKTQNLKQVAWAQDNIAIAYVKPYQFNTSIYNNDKSGKHDINVNYNEIKIAYSFQQSSFFNIGVGLDLIRQSYQCNTNCDNSQIDTSESALGYGFSLGLLGHWEFIESSDHPLQLKVGANYRSAAQIDDLKVLGYEAIAPTRPESTSIGTSLNMPFTIGTIPISATASLQIESLNYDALAYPFIHEGELIFGSLEQDESRNSIGFEFKAPIHTEIDLYLRTGYAATSANSQNYTPGQMENGKDLNAFGVNTYYLGANSDSFTIGLGLTMPNWAIDFAAENRKITQRDPDNSDASELTLMSLSASYLF